MYNKYDFYSDSSLYKFEDILNTENNFINKDYRDLDIEYFINNLSQNFRSFCLDSNAIN